MSIMGFSDSQSSRQLSSVILIPQSGFLQDNLGLSIVHSSGSDSTISPLKKSIEAIETNKERKENLKLYNEIKDYLYQNYSGKYAVIAKGQLQKIGDSFDEVKDMSMDANHRFIFKIEKKPQVKRKLRWPMRRKK